ncbi:MAG: DUF4492 domain-containing protein [Candidatus Electrothrix sp. ATG2]|nr:DUF4492 domain-containing protein [Candidatus Electrothrix sp. ATG2]
MKHHLSLFQKVYRFYIDGFGNMTLGKTLWKIIFIKLVIMFAVLKLFFFEDFLGAQFSTDKQRGDYVLSELTGPVQANNTFLRQGEQQ